MIVRALAVMLALSAPALAQEQTETGTGAVLRGLDKLNAKVSDITLKNGEATVLGLIENMSSYVCPNCGHEAHLFGEGGVAKEAQKIGAPLLAQLPLSLDVRLAGDAGKPVALTEGAVGEAYRALAADLIQRGIG